MIQGKTFVRKNQSLRHHFPVIGIIKTERQKYLNVYMNLFEIWRFVSARKNQMYMNVSEYISVITDKS